MLVNENIEIKGSVSMSYGLDSTFVRPAYQLNYHNDQKYQLINNIKCLSTTTFKQQNLPLRLTKELDITYNDQNIKFCKIPNQ